MGEESNYKEQERAIQPSFTINLKGNEDYSFLKKYGIKQGLTGKVTIKGDKELFSKDYTKHAKGTNKSIQTQNTKNAELRKKLIASKAKSKASVEAVIKKNNINKEGLTDFLYRDYQNYRKLNPNATISDFKKYKEKEHKDAQTTKDYALKAGTGIVGIATAASIIPTIGAGVGSEALKQGIKIGGKQIGKFAFDLGKSMVGSEAARSTTKAIGGNETAQTIAGYIGGGFGGLGKSAFTSGLKQATLEGTINSASIGAFDQTYKNINAPEWLKMPLATASSLITRRGLANGSRAFLKKTAPKWTNKAINANQNNMDSSLSEVGHIRYNYEGANTPLRKLGVYTGAEALKYAPTLIGAGVTGAAVDAVDDPNLKTIVQYMSPFVLGKVAKGMNSLNRSGVQWLSYMTGGTDLGPKIALQNALNIALDRPNLVNSNLPTAKLNTKDQIKATGKLIWDYLPIHINKNGIGRRYRPGGYGFMHNQSEKSLSENWGNGTLDNPNSHLLGNMFGGNAKISGILEVGNTNISLSNNGITTLPNLANQILRTKGGYERRYGDRNQRVIVTGNKVNPQELEFATGFDKKGNPTGWSKEIKDLNVLYGLYNSDTGYMGTNSKTGNTRHLVVNTKGQPFAVARSTSDPNKLYAVGSDLYGLGSGKTNYFSLVIGSYMDAYTNPYITLSFNAYKPTKKPYGPSQSFNSRTYSDVPVYE